MNRHQYEGPWHKKQEVNEMPPEEPEDFRTDTDWLGASLFCWLFTPNYVCKFQI